MEWRVGEMDDDALSVDCEGGCEGGCVCVAKNEIRKSGGGVGDWG